MKAFWMKWAYKGITTIDIGPDYELPDVFCSACGEEWGCGFDLPSLNPPWIKEYRYKESGDRPVVTFNDFLTLAKRMKKWDPNSIDIIPGAFIGPLSGTATIQQIPEFFCNSSEIIVDKDTLQKLEGYGLSVRTGGVSIRIGRQKTIERFVLQPSIIDALAPEQRRQVVRKECQTCGFVDVYPAVSIASLGDIHWCFRKEVLEQHPYFFVVRETGGLVFTELFLRLVRSFNVPDLKSVHEGDFVY